MSAESAGGQTASAITAERLRHADLLPAFRLLISGAIRLPPAIVLASLCINISSLLMPLVVMQVYDRVVPNHSFETLLMLCLMSFGVMILEAVIRTSRAHLVSWAATRHAWAVHNDTIGRLLSAPHAWWADESASHVVDRVKAINTVSEWQSSPSRLVLLDVPFVILFLGLMTLTGGPLVLVPLAVFAVVGWLMWQHGRLMRRAGATVAACDMRMNDFLAESLSGVMAIKGNALEAQMQRRFERLQNAASHAADEQIRRAEQARSHADLMAAIAQVLTMAAGAAAVMVDTLSVGTLACCTLLSGRALQPLLRCTAMWNEIQSIAVDRSKAERIDTLPPARILDRSADSAGPLGFRLTEVTVPSTADVHPSLDGADLVVGAGDIVACLGIDGPGTSPLAAVLTGRLQPVSGTVHFVVEGGDAADARPNQVLVVSPQHRLLDGTIMENLSGFRGGPAVTAAGEASRLIGLDQDIRLLTAGYDTRVGNTLSSDIPDSIVRRIAVARAIAAAPGILILDCANEGLDSASERLLADGLKCLRRRMTIVILTNRPSFAAVADRVYAIRGGRFEPIGHPAGGAT